MRIPEGLPLSDPNDGKALEDAWRREGSSTPWAFLAIVGVAFAALLSAILIAIAIWLTLVAMSPAHDPIAQDPADESLVLVAVWGGTAVSVGMTMREYRNLRKKAGTKGASARM